MFTRLIHPEDDDRYSSADDSRFCHHGYLHRDCTACEDEDDVDIDKCLNCGRYRASSSLNQDQVCSHGCVNPNEY